ncbi:LITAF-like zinc ribbon domain-containing protein [Tricladium varicosporioides]|nr:LITAF-like zinc ribbon domain-containing protein [Hymenoscyphus varicosporioides]
MANYVSPQSTGVPTGNGTISPQITGVIPAHSEAPPPNYGASSDGHNEKMTYNVQQPHPDMSQAEALPGQHVYQQQLPIEEQQKQQQQPVPQHVQYATATPLASLTQGPAPVDCPVCRTRQMTAIEFVSGGTTHLAALVLCCCFCLGCIPYCASWFKDVEHKCGNCGALLAVYHRSGSTEVTAHATV